MLEPIQVSVSHFALKQQARPTDVALSMVRIQMNSQTISDLADRWLCGAEIERFHRFRVESGRCDFLAGRIAAKSGLMKMFESNAPDQWEIVNGTNGEPSIAGPGSDSTVTITHSDGIGIAAIATEGFRCGIDLETCERDIGDVIQSQVSREEAIWAQKGGQREKERWILLWTTREAFGKSLGTGLLDPDRLLPTTGWRESHNRWTASFKGTDQVGVGSVVQHGFVASIVAPQQSLECVLSRWHQQFRDLG
jgi:phosphopantetheinyl transferase